MTSWKEVSEERFYEMLGAVPPIYISYGFLVGEASDHRRCRVSGQVRESYATFVHVGERFFESNTPLTVAEARAFDTRDLRGDTP